jgi:hypothetical protein
MGYGIAGLNKPCSHLTKQLTNTFSLMAIILTFKHYNYEYKDSLQNRSRDIKELLAAQ